MNANFGLNLSKYYSINFDLPKRSKKKIIFIILHYTGMKTESAAIKRLGADLIACDITFDRCFSTEKKLNLIDNNYDHLTINSSAENLPIKDEVFDYVYSNNYNGDIILETQK